MNKMLTNQPLFCENYGQAAIKTNNELYIL